MRKLANRIYRGVEWRSERSAIAWRARRLDRLARRLGFPAWPEEREPARPTPPSPRGSARPHPVGSGALAAATVCTVDHLHFARALAASFCEHHPQANLVVLVIDASPTSPSEVEDAIVLRGAEIGFPRRPYQALALSASELCCAAKPRLLDYLLEHGSYDRILYLDSDIQLFAPLDAMLAALERCDFVVTPHMMSPFPNPERPWEFPRLGDIAAAGVLNAGMFGFRSGPRARDFVSVWTDMVESPTAFTHGEAEQQSFNWLPCFADSVHILRDPAYNVAYWNLHERSLRRGAGHPQDGGAEYTVNGEPLVAFHFSGFDPRQPLRLSHWDGRHTAYHHGPLAQLLEAYATLLAELDQDGCSAEPYGFGRFPSGIEIDHRMRHVFKRYYPALQQDLDPFTAEGERHYCRALLSPAPGSGSLVPALLQEILDERPDLRTIAPDAATNPLPLVRWFSTHGTLEHGYSEIFDRYRPVIPSWDGLLELDELGRRHPRALFGDIAEPLGAGRSRFLSRYSGEPFAEDILGMKHERFAVSPLWLVRDLTEDVPELRNAYPDLLLSDAERFASWLELFGTLCAYLPSAACRAFRRTSQGQSLARIYSLMSRHWPMMERFPLALIGHDRDQFAVALLRLTGRTPEFDLDDIVMYLWLMEVRPAYGLSLTFSLPYNATRFSLRTNWQDQLTLLQPVLDDPRLMRALHEHRHRSPRQPASSRPPAKRSWHAVESARADLPRSAATPSPRPRGVNLFGYFKSPIGLGYMSRGLETALAHGGVEIARNLLPHAHMDDRIFPEDFTEGFEERMSHNIFVGFPHNEESLLRSRNAEVVRGRTNVAYLAWEQREAHPLWELAFRDFDQVWALSDFAAAALAEGLGREVSAVPCVIDADAFPSPASKAAMGLREDCFTVLFVFDPGSSVERKNPLAAVAACARAFHPRERVRLVIRLANYRPAEHRPTIERIAQRAAKEHLDVDFLTAPMDRTAILRLISAADCYLSLHRAEGFGFTCAEAMAYGKPTIATGYSGNLTFMDGECSFLVDYEEAEVLVPDGPFRRGSPWAEPSIEHASHHLRTVFKNPSLAAEVGRRARRRVRDLLSKERVSQIVLAALAGRAGGQEERADPARVAGQASRPL